MHNKTRSMFSMYALISTSYYILWVAFWCRLVFIAVISLVIDDTFVPSYALTFKQHIIIQSFLQPYEQTLTRFSESQKK